MLVCKVDIDYGFCDYLLNNIIEYTLEHICTVKMADTILLGVSGFCRLTRCAGTTVTLH